MPLDTGAVANDFGLSWAAEQDVAVQAPTLDDGPHIGAALRLIREFSGRSLEDLALTTRIRRHYLHSIEVLNLDQLPSRPFTIGYVRAYALALGLDGDRAVARFRRDAPDPDEPLRAPVGVRREADPRLMLVLICGLVVAGGILTWNFVERAISRKPPPQESTTPKPYYPPGMAKSLADSGSSVAATAAATATAADQATAEGQPQAQLVGAPFVAAGEVFGDAAPADSIILQARQPSSITVHRPDGAIDFARFLAAGQAYRAPLIKGWKVEVSEPASVDVFVGGRLQGPMPAPAAAITDLAKADAPAH
jgi:cytoskeletal protein RodZ